MSFFNFARDSFFGNEWADPFFSSGFVDPFRELRRLDREVNRLTRNFARWQQQPLLEQQQQGQQQGQQQLEGGQQGEQQGQQLQQWPSQQQQLSLWTPRLDIKESDKDVELCAELPGVKKEDVKIELENGLLKISGEQKEEKREENERFSHMERNFGYFTRYLNVGENVKEGDIQANFENGVLTVKFPKPEETRRAERKSIPIKEGARELKGAEGKEEIKEEATKGAKEEIKIGGEKNEEEGRKGEEKTAEEERTGEEKLKTGEEETKGADEKLDDINKPGDLKSGTEGTVLGKPEDEGKKEGALEKAEGIERQPEKLTTPAQ